MKKILLSLSVLAFVGIVVAQGTGAFFTDTETSTGNTFTSGTLELDIDHNGSGSTWNLGLGNVTLNPGDETATTTIIIGNSGTMPLAWLGYFNTSGNDAMLDNIYIKSAQMEFFDPSNNTWEPTGTDVFITNGRGSGSAAAYFNSLADTTAQKVVTLRAWNSAANNLMGAGAGVQAGALKPQYTYRFTFSLGMVDDAPNSIQGKSLGLSYTVTSTQINQAALNALSNANPRLQGNLGDTLLTWFNDQIAKQH